MKTRSFFSVALAAVVFFTLASGVIAKEPEKSKPMLKKGMDRDAVVSICGRPTEIQPFGKAETKAEQWIYRRKVSEISTQVPTGVASVPAFVGNSGSGSPMIGEAASTEYRLKHIVVYRVAALLMVDGKLVTSKEWSEKEEKFAD